MSYTEETIQNNTYSSVRATRHLYEFPQSTELVAVQEYLFTNNSGKHCCLLKWIKYADFYISSMTFDLTELDASGKELDTTRHTVYGNSIPPTGKGETFAPGVGLVVANRCKNVRVKLLEVKSDDYTYRIENNVVKAYYDIEPLWESDSKKEHKDRKKHLKRDADKSVRSKLGKRPFIIRLSVIVTLFLLMTFILQSFFDRLIIADWLRMLFPFI